MAPILIRDAPAADAPEPWRGARVGLLGGSFNPAHGGHRHISLRALDRLGLDYVWWLVSPQNPLKSAAGMAPMEDRLAVAREVAAHPRLIVSDIERAFGTRHTAATLERLIEAFPETRFLWIMGADNLRQIDRWRDWQKIFRCMAIAIFDRPSYSLGALSGSAARRFARHRLPRGRARSLIDRRPPAWVFFRGRRHFTSATAIRAARDRSAGGNGPAS